MPEQVIEEGTGAYTASLELKAGAVSMVYRASAPTPEEALDLLDTIRNRHHEGDDN